MSAIEKYLQSVAANVAAEGQTSDEFDTLEAATKWHVSRSKAQTLLAADVATGKLTTRLAKDGNAWRRVYKLT